MKKVIVKLDAELEVPDNWKIEEDENGEGIITIEGKSCTFDIISTWFDDIEDEEEEDKMDEAVYDTVQSVVCEIEEV